MHRFWKFSNTLRLTCTNARTIATWLVAVFVIMAVLLIASQAALAQPDSGMTDGQPWAFEFTMPVKIATLVILAALTWAFCLWILYPGLLKAESAAWPRTLFGRVTALAWFLVTMLTLSLLWDDLPLPADDPSFWTEHGPRILVLMVGVGLSFLCGWVYRSPVPKAAPTRK